jgi:hypothetical protein
VEYPEALGVKNFGKEGTLGLLGLIRPKARIHLSLPRCLMHIHMKVWTLREFGTLEFWGVVSLVSQRGQRPEPRGKNSRPFGSLGFWEFEGHARRNKKGVFRVEAPNVKLS